MASIPEAVTIALIGAGLIGPRHAISILKTPGVALHSVVDPSSAAAEWAASIPTPYFPTLDALLSSTPLPTAALIATPNHTHTSIATILANAGIHLLIEKPLCTSVSEGRALVALAKEKKIKILVGHHRRFNPHVRLTKSLVAAPASSPKSLGTILAVSGLWTLLKPPSYYEAPTEWRQKDSAGVVMINLVHDIDILQFCFGRIARVHAESTVRTRGFEADEGAAVIFKFESGVVGTFIVCDATPSVANLEGGTGENPTIWTPTPGQEEHEGKSEFYRVFGTKGSLGIGRGVRRYHYDRRDGEGGWGQELKEEKEMLEEGIVAFDLQTEHFGRVVRGEEESMCTVEEGLSAVVVCEAVRDSMKNGGMPVDID